MMHIAWSPYSESLRARENVCLRLDGVKVLLDEKLIAEFIITEDGAVGPSFDGVLAVSIEQVSEKALSPLFFPTPSVAKAQSV